MQRNPFHPNDDLEPTEIDQEWSFLLSDPPKEWVEIKSIDNGIHGDKVPPDDT